MSELELTRDEKALMKIVPKNGTTMGNHRAKSLLTWNDARYWPVRDSLIDKGLLTRGKGQGGSIRLVLQIEVAEMVTVTAPTDTTSGVEEPVVVDAVLVREDALYEPLSRVIEGAWAKEHRFNLSSVTVTARQGKRATGGKWSRPDIVAVEVRTLIYYPTKVLRITTFEVKPADAVDVQSVYEALAHRRAATHAYIMLHVPSAEAGAVQATLDEILAVARTHGVGVITFSDPDNFDTWQELEEAHRFDTDPERLDNFIATQLPENVRNRVNKDLK